MKTTVILVNVVFLTKKVKWILGIATISNEQVLFWDREVKLIWKIKHISMQNMFTILPIKEGKT